MKALSLHRALAKTNAVVKQNADRNGKWFAVLDDRLLEWWENHGSVDCLNCRRVDDQHDMYTDYHAGHFARTLKGAVEYLTQTGVWAPRIIIQEVRRDDHV